MLIVSGLVEIKPENAQAAIAAAREMAIASNEEAGCHSYAFYADLEVEGRFRVFEEWEDLAALEEHFETPHMKAFREALGKIGVLSRSVWRYDVACKTQL